MLQGSWSKNIWWILIDSPFRMAETIKYGVISQVLLLTLVVAKVQNDTIILETPFLFKI
jgi:hypothetical protein